MNGTEDPMAMQERRIDCYCWGCGQDLFCNVGDMFDNGSFVSGTITPHLTLDGGLCSHSGNRMMFMLSGEANDAL